MSSPDPKPKPQRKPTRRKDKVYEVPPSELAPSLTWIERLRRDIRTGGVGLLVSLIIHAVVLVILGFIWFRVGGTGGGDDDLVATFGPAGAARGGKSGRKLTPVAIPFNLGASANVIDTTPARSNTGTSDGKGVGQGQGDSVGNGAGVSPVDVSGSLGGRSPRIRGSNLEKSGGTSEAEKAVKSGLLWLVRQQESDGHWELHQGYPDHGFPWARTDTGATAMALMCFLGQGNTHQDGEFSEAVDKGIKWLLAMQDPSTGDFHDMRREEGREGAFYAHSMATIVVCEALALTGDAKLRPSAEAAVKYLLMAQHPDKGGWKFRPISKLMDGDLAVTGWALMALHTARMAGIEIEHEDFVRASAFLDSVKVKGSARYKFDPIYPDSTASPAMTAEALLCRQWFGWPKDFPEMVQGVRYISADDQAPSWTEGRRNVFQWYFTSQVLHNIGGDDWKKWNKAVQKAIIGSQVTGGSAKKGADTRGSWNPTSPAGAPREFAEKGGRLYITTMCILILETPYRHQPIYAAAEVAKE